MEAGDIPDLKASLAFMKVLNYVFILKINGILSLFDANPFDTVNQIRALETLSEASVDVIFPDKLKNLKGHPLKTMFYDQPPRIKSRNGIVYGPEAKFLSEIAEQRNAKIINYRLISSDPQKISEIVSRELRGFKIDVVINTGVLIDHGSQNLYWKTINTYDVDGYCAMLPYTHTRSHLDFLFKPFDTLTWIFVSVSMAVCTILWKLLNLRSSHQIVSPMYFIFAFFCSIFGQLIPFRNVRPMQKTILVITVVVTFVLGAFYDSIITASLLNFNYVVRMQTIDEMIKKNFSFLVDNVFNVSMGHSEYYKKIEPMIIGFSFNSSSSFKDLALDRIVIIEHCSDIDNAFLAGDASDFYYKLKQKFNTFYLNFPLSKATYFQSLFNDFSLRVFESGLRSLWKYEFRLQVHENFHRDKTSDAIYLGLNEIIPVFYILSLGLTLATVIFFLEIFYNDCFQYLLLALIKYKRKRKRNSKKRKIIQVQSRISDNN